MKERVSLLFIEYGEIDVIDGAFVVLDATGVRTQIPVGSIACLMLEPGTRVSHRAAALAARAGTLLVWVGEAGVRLYSAGQPGGARADRLLDGAPLASCERLPTAELTQTKPTQTKPTQTKPTQTKPTRSRLRRSRLRRS